MFIFCDDDIMTQMKLAEIETKIANHISGFFSNSKKFVIQHKENLFHFISVDIKDFFERTFERTIKIAQRKFR